MNSFDELKIILLIHIIPSYLGNEEKIGMISKRLTKTQKDEIVEAYRAGDETNSIAEKYGCTSNTVNRTVKNFLSDSEYSLLKKQRSRISNKNLILTDKKTLKYKPKDLKSPSSSKLDSKNDLQSIKTDDGSNNPNIQDKESLLIDDDDFSSSESKKFNIHDIDENDQKYENNFEEIAPLLNSFDFNQEKQKSKIEILNNESLPEIVYMIVDKKVELESQAISEIPEWSFLPENELKRKAILLFSNQRSAKRICSRNQRVIKIPNSSIFQLSRSYLVSNGITRLILEDSIISLDN